MNNTQSQNDSSNSDQPNRFEGLLWIILIILILALAGVLVQRNWEKLSVLFGGKDPVSFDEVMVTKGLHDVTLESGRAYDISYETSRKRNFAGLVRHTSEIQEPMFAILTFDILITSGDYSNPDLVQTSVTNHHFTWMSSSPDQPQGTINLLHTVPVNDEVKRALKSIQEGDTVIITGYDIYRIEGYDPEGNYVGFWEDSGCNTTLVSNVEIYK